MDWDWDWYKLITTATSSLLTFSPSAATASAPTNFLCFLWNFFGIEADTACTNGFLFNTLSVHSTFARCFSILRCTERSGDTKGNEKNYNLDNKKGLKIDKQDTNKVI